MLDVSSPGHDLEQRHAVAEHVGFGGDRLAADPLWREVVPDGSAHGGQDQDAAEVSADELGEPEVGHLGRQVGVEEDDLRLDVAVDDAVRPGTCRAGRRAPWRRRARQLSV